MTAAALEAVGLAKAFGGNRVVDGVSFRIGGGECLALVGPNGAGKTSLLNLLAGQFRPSAGRVLLAGRDVTGLDPCARPRRPLFRSYQDGGMFGRLDAVGNVAIAGIVRGMARPAAERMARDALDQVGLGPVAGWAADQLSGGQRKLIDFARLLVARPEVALLDEPTAGVNPTIMVTMRAVVERMRAAGTSFLVISHDLPWAFGICERVVVLRSGRVLAEGDPATIVADPRVREAYLA